MESPRLEEFLNLIMSGEFDDDWDVIVETRKQRIRRQTRTKMKGLEFGDKVKFNSLVRPRYLAGVEATVVKKNETSVMLVLNETKGRFVANSPFRCPATLVEKI